MTRLLIVEDEEIAREELRDLLLRKGWEVEVAGSVREAERMLVAGRFDVVLADVRLPGAYGTALLGRCGEARVVMMSAYASVDSAVEAMRLGAVDYVTKPINPDDLLARLARAAPPRRAASEEILVGESEPIREVRRLVRLVAATDLSVLVLGESGTGKELVARAVHQQSARHAADFISINCGAIADALVDSELFGYEAGAFPGATEARVGPFESASGGTVFLDEVAKLPASAQARLLRVLKEREVWRVGATRARRIDVRIVAATNQDLQLMMDARTFADDLFFRLSVFNIHLAPLRERDRDLFILAHHILAQACTRDRRPPVTLSEAARSTMRAHPWPGNVRELQNRLESALVLCDGEVIDAPILRIKPGALGARENSTDHEDPSIDGYFRRFVVKNNNRLTKKEMAALLGMSTTTLWRWCDRLDIELPSR